MTIRTCSVAGMFYPREPSHLEQLLEKFFRNTSSTLNAFGIISPHAGYVYSGQIAACAFRAIPETFSGTFIVIGPSHRGYLTCTSSIPWETPLGILNVDQEIVTALDIKIDEFSHQSEHSIEVQLPFIKYRFPRAMIVPIMMGDQDSTNARNLADAIYKAICKMKKEVKIVASSDFSHYVPDKYARQHDTDAIKALKNLDIEEFYRRIAAEGVSACGYGPIASTCLVCKVMGARNGELLQYGTSGDVTGDYDQVVGYGAIAVV